MGTHASGRLPEFNGTSWGSWFGRLQVYFEASNIVDPSKKKPSTPAAEDYDHIVAALQKHYDPMPSEVYSRTLFQRRDQMEAEAVSAYVAAMKKLDAIYNFGPLPTTTVATEHPVATPPVNPFMLPLDIMLRGRFVCGLRDNFLQQRLFTETEYTFARAYDIDIRPESAGKQQRDIRKPTEPAYLANHQLQPHQAKGEKTPKAQRCWRCDEQNSPQSCKLLGATCHFCKKRGQIEKACITNRKQSRKPPERHKRVNASQAITQEKTHGSLPASPALYDLNTVLNLHTQPKIMIHVTVHHQPIHLELDSGAACTLSSE
ncbi:uncharacterized protein LOC144143321 [Haemaphysalis longicornis]